MYLCCVIHERIRIYHLMASHFFSRAFPLNFVLFIPACISKAMASKVT
jgi:hypothetical protein